MSECIFCQIVAQKIPCFKVFEDDNFLGFLDIKPLNPGNSLLIPKTHYRWVYDVPNFGNYFEIAKKIGLATLPIVKAEAITFLTLGFEVPHAHIHIIPRFPDDAHRHGIDTEAVIAQTTDQMAQLARQISAAVLP